MIHFGQRQDKTPFQWNVTNNYMQYNQGKKHFWGVGGKDYGILQSPQDTKRKGKYYPPIQSLQNSHLTLTPIPAKSNMQSPAKRFQTDHQINQLQQSRAQGKYIRQGLIQSQQGYNGHLQQTRLRTEPVQNMIPQKTLSQDRRALKKLHLSLDSRNINLSNQMTPVGKKQTSPSLHHEFSVEIRPEMKAKNTLNYQERTTKKDFTKREIEDYRQQIVRIVRKDRRNNPTFCNSLAYPLYCHRYVQ